MLERTLSIIKPDAVERDLQNDINKIISSSGLKILAKKELLMNKKIASFFYEVHKDRPFFDDLVVYMSSGPVVVQVLEGENAIAKYRDLMGATNPKDAAEGTIRKQYAIDIEKNSAHGSDSSENAINEIKFFFSRYELLT